MHFHAHLLQLTGRHFMLPTQRRRVSIETYNDNHTLLITLAYSIAAVALLWPPFYAHTCHARIQAIYTDSLNEAGAPKENC